MRYEFHALSDPGLVRQNNEDAVLHDSQLGLALLADGMGGYNAGEVASAMALDCIEAEFAIWLATGGSRAPDRSVRRVMSECAAHANAAIVEAARADPDCAGMGTTLVFAVFLRERIFIGHLGDSRCYRWRQGVLARLTQDHSVLQEQLDAGLISSQDAATAPFRNLVTRALGVEDRVELEIAQHAPEPGDMYLLCSDGLTDMLDDLELAALLRALPGSNQPIEGIAAMLIDAANRAGGRDNASVLLVRATSEPA